MYYITTPIPYVNGEAHLGHLLEALYNDTIARYKRRVLTEPVMFCMGLDQHGLKIHQKAAELKLETPQYIKRESDKFKNLWKKFEISNDVFVETSSLEHKVVSQIVWNKLLAKNLIYKKKYTGLYCVGCEAFYSESQLTDDGCCQIHLTKPIEMSEENYFFKLSAFVDPILDFLKNNNISPDKARKEWTNFVDGGLEDISVSREKTNLPWGIAVPNDEDQVMYVWFEALVNYMTGLVATDSVDKYLEFPLQKDEFEGEIWQDIIDGLPIDLQFMGKDMPKFHLVLWIGILSALNLPLTVNNIVHGYINDSEGKKMSKSLGNGVSPAELVAKFGVEGTRFVMLHDMNVIDDTSFDWGRVSDSFNANLANNLGNLVVRVTTLVEKYLNGIVNVDLTGGVEIEEVFQVNLNNVYKELEAFNTQKAFQNLFAEATKINQYLENTKPWMLGKDLNENHAKIEQILTICVKDLVEIGKALSIFMPETGDKIYSIFSSDRIVKAEVLFGRID